MDRRCQVENQWFSGDKLSRFLAVLSFLFYFMSARAVVEDDLTPPSVRMSNEPSYGREENANAYKTASDGVYKTLEFNPADLLSERLRFSGEYLVVDGLSFGGVFEAQRQETDLWRHSTIGASVTLSQYFTSQSLKGPFLRGELGAMGSVFRVHSEEGNAFDRAVYGANLGMDMGYRVNFGNYFTTHAAYGVRRVVPDFFGTQGDQAKSAYEARTKIWTMRVLLALGVAL
jgi:hypothetical protein